MRRGLARSRGEAKDLIAAGRVRAGNQVVSKTSTDVASSDVLEVSEGSRWVSRAAMKLDHAFTLWGRPGGLSARGARCLDVGASTGGFTQVLLHQGARQVVALDVGHGQLVADIARDDRVEELSGVSIRDVDPGTLGTFEVVVADVSFISLTVVLQHLYAFATPGGDVVALIKPQFEVGKAGLTKNGVVRDPGARLRVLDRVVQHASSRGLGVHGLAPSPISGQSGNIEYLLWARAQVSSAIDPATAVAAVGIAEQ